MMDRMLFLLGVMQARANQKNPLDAPSMISRAQPASLCFGGELGATCLAVDCGSISRGMSCKQQYP